MTSKILKRIKFLVILAIIIAFIWFLAVYPTYRFKQYESEVQKAAERYYELNPTKLPTGKRISTVTLQELYTGSYLKEDLYIPYTKSPCSTVNSWVKVGKSDNKKYRYYIYLECGAIKSIIDHKGPKITLKGDTEQTIEVSDKYEDPGIEKVYDKTDGNINIENVVVKNNVDPKTPGEYTITYTAADNFGNKTTVERKITVINTLVNQIKKDLKDEKRFKGNPKNNNIKLSNMDFKIMGIDDDNNVIVVTDHPISYINYNKIDKWLNDYYYNLLNDDTKKMIVEKKYCSAVDDVSSTNCTKTTDKRKLYYPSLVDVNMADEGYTGSFLYQVTPSWINGLDKEITTYGESNMANFGDKLAKKGKTDIAAISPMFTISGKEIILEGNGSTKYPYKLGDHKNVTGDKKISDLNIGDVIYNKGTYYIVMAKSSDGSVKVISNGVILNKGNQIKITNGLNTPLIYNPNKKKNIGYNINNQLTKYVDKTIFKSHNIEVPIYNNKVVYGEEKKKTQYKVLFSAPNIFEIYSTPSSRSIRGSYWLINSSLEENVGVYIDDSGNVKDSVYIDDSYSARVVAYINSDLFVSGGNGSLDDPYIIR